MEKNLWEQRYASGEYVYGISPNVFFKEQLDLLKPGRILLPADGQGRNGVYAAEKGWKVVCYDISPGARKNAKELALTKGVKILYLIAGWEDFYHESEYYDAVALIYVHAAGKKRQDFHRKVAASLKPGGTLIFEGFSKEQLCFRSGGPKNIEMLFSEEELMEDFAAFSKIDARTEVITLEEGGLHQGNASVVRVTGIK